MSSTCVYSDIVLPTATWYEKDDLNTSDMHPFIHPLSKATDPAWEARSDWDIYKGLAKKFSEISAFEGNLGVEKDIVTIPMLHDTPGELAQPFDIKDWEKRRVRAGARQDGSQHGGGRARLPQSLQEVHLGRASA